MTEYHFKRTRTDKTTREEALTALEKAAAYFQYHNFGKRDLSRAGVGLSASAVRNAFDGSWSAAVAALKNRLQAKGIDLVPSTRRIWTNEQMFEELGRIWNELGHRPSKGEWQSFKPRITYNTYKQRFRGWKNACLRFMEYMSGANASSEAYPSADTVAEQNRPRTKELVDREDRQAERREPTQSLINKVWKRDNFRCKRCGKSPAIDFGTKLEIDHITPWAKGGRTTFDNLQTLCSGCNRSKKDETS